MNQANVEKLVSKLRYNVKPRRKLKNADGPIGRIRKIQKTLTALLKYERLELNYNRADETRGYVERVCVYLSFMFYINSALYILFYNIFNVIFTKSEFNMYN